jgi:hypothetical protein
MPTLENREEVIRQIREFRAQDRALMVKYTHTLVW